MVQLQTERLILRELTMDDVPALHELEQHPEVARWVWLPPPPVEAVRGNVEFIVKSAVETPRVVYVLGIVTKTDNRLIGRCGFDITGPDGVEGSLGYALRHDCWGQGYMSEAVRALIGYAFGELKLHRVWADADPRNVGSWRVMEKVGMRREGHMIENYNFQGEWCDSYLYAMLEREWAVATG